MATEKLKIRPARRGTAEIELILIITILIALLLLSMGAMKISAARMSVAGSASYEAFHNVTEDATPQYTGDTAVDGFTSVRPDPTLPNRVHEPTESTVVTGGDGNKGTFTAKVSSKAALIGPPWTYNSYPVGQADQDIMGQWFTNYVDESHNGLTYPLGLSPEWTP